MIDAPGGSECITVRDLPVPQPKTGEVLIRVAFSPLNPLDIQARAGRIRWNHPGFPFVPGCAFAGRIVQLGEGVAAGLRDRRVTVAGCWGGNAEYAVAPVTNVTPIPERFSWTLGAVAAGTTRTAWHLLHSAARLRAGQTLVLHSAAGAVGTLTAQMARTARARVIGLAGGPAKVAYASRYVDQALDYNSGDWPGRVKELTGGTGADVIIDGNSGPNAARNYEAVGNLGQIIYTGAMAGPAPEVSIPMLIGRSISVTGFVVTFHEARDPLSGRAETEDRLARGEWLIPVQIIGELDDVAELHRRFENRELCGRTLIRIGGEI